MLFTIRWTEFKKVYINENFAWEHEIVTHIQMNINFTPFLKQIKTMWTKRTSRVSTLFLLPKFEGRHLLCYNVVWMIIKPKPIIGYGAKWRCILAIDSDFARVDVEIYILPLKLVGEIYRNAVKLDSLFLMNLILWI